MGTPIICGPVNPMMPSITSPIPALAARGTVKTIANMIPAVPSVTRRIVASM
jgi:hypothetical protein